MMHLWTYTDGVTITNWNTSLLCNCLLS